MSQGPIVREPADARRGPALRLIRDAAVIVVALLLSFAASDDITTDNDTDFTLEYGALGICWIAVMLVAAGLLRRGHRVLGVSSAVVLAAALWGSRLAIRPGIVPGWWPEYVVVVGTFLWFALLSVVLLSIGWRALSK